MTQEEKAEAYDEVREKIVLRFGSNVAEEIFSGFEKSEDERVREALVEIFSLVKENKKPVISKEDAELILAWLEKQKDTNVLIQEASEKAYTEGMRVERKHWLEKQGEQKVSVADFKAKDWYVSKVDGKIRNIYHSVDKVEPKFKVGGWVVYDHRPYQVVELPKEGYINLGLRGRNGKIEWAPSPYCRHWTIEDAKEGDVLIDKSHVGECVFIFKEARPSDIKTDVNNPLAIIGYCGINHIGFTSQLSGLGFGDTVNCTYYPATKEQRDLLFAKMKEAGYEWDAEKKELKKIHVIDEGKDEMDDCFTKMMNSEKVSPTWSEEDEKFFKTALWHISYSITNGNSTDCTCDMTEWFKSLKQRLGGK